MRIFLGGTCAGSEWRDRFVKLLDDDIEYFNPVVDNWTEKAQRREKIERIRCDKVLYCITPKMEGVYSIAEATEDAINNGDKCVFVYLREDDGSEFSDAQLKSLAAVGELLDKYGALVYTSLEETADYFNGRIDQ